MTLIPSFSLAREKVPKAVEGALLFALLLAACTSHTAKNDADTVTPDGDTAAADDAVEMGSDDFLFVEVEKIPNDDDTIDDSSLPDTDIFSHTTKQWGTLAGDRGNAIAIDMVGNVYVAGDTWGTFDGSTNEPADWADIFLTKWNVEGTMAWTKQLGTLTEEFGRSVAIDPSGILYVTGETNGSLDGNTSVGEYDIFLSMWKSDGSKIGTKQWGTSGSEFGFAIAADSFGHMYVTGCSGNMYGGTGDVFLAKLNADSTVAWTQQWGTSDLDAGNAVAVDSTGNIYVTGHTLGALDGNANIGGEDIFLTKWNADGTKAWTKQWGTSDADTGQSVVVDSTGSIYVTGIIEACQVGHEGMLFDVFLTKWNTDGTEVWTKQWGAEAEGRAVTVDTQGNIYVAGTTWSSFDGNKNAGGICDGFACPDIFLTKWSTDGTKVWTKQWGSAAADLGNAVAVGTSGDIYVAGGTAGSLDGNTNSGGYDVFLSIIPDE